MGVSGCLRSAKTMIGWVNIPIFFCGDFQQAQRRDILGKFRRQGGRQVLICSDLGKNGLDITDVSLVINYDFPLRGDVFEDRAGRAGRVEKGYTFSMVKVVPKPSKAGK